MLFIPSTTYADSVLAGEAHGIDGVPPSARELDPTNIHDLAVYFLYPQWVFGMEHRIRWPAPRSDKGHPLMLERRDKESYRSASDGTEYFVPEHRIDEFTDGTKESRRMPWVRVTEKEKRRGHTRREQLREERTGEVA